MAVHVFPTPLRQWELPEIAPEDVRPVLLLDEHGRAVQADVHYPVDAPGPVIARFSYPMSGRAVL